MSDLELMQKQIIQQENFAAIGYLAAGIAHEINNPLGFVMSNFDTLSKYYEGIGELIRAYKVLNGQIRNGKYNFVSQHLKIIEDIEKKNNIDFILNDIHDIFYECHDGLMRIRDIVIGLSSFVKSGSKDMYEMYDINTGIETVLLMTQNELKYHAEIKRELNKVPLIRANGNQIN